MKTEHNMRVADFRPEYAGHFYELNRAWIEEYFTLEPIDRYVLENPYETILDKGGKILFVLINEEVAGTVALMPLEDGVFELTKMAVDKKFQGFGAGKMLCAAAIAKAGEMGVKRLILYSNSGLKTAVGIYEKLGFVHLKVEEGKYKRADVKMEKYLFVSRNQAADMPFTL